MREGIRRLAVAIRWLSILWIVGLGGTIAYLRLSGEMTGGSSSDKIGGVLFIVLPGLFGLGIAWIVDGFAKSKRPE